jgi:hypothetical protein
MKKENTKVIWCLGFEWDKLTGLAGFAIRSEIGVDFKSTNNC